MAYYIHVCSTIYNFVTNYANEMIYKKHKQIVYPSLNLLMICSLAKYDFILVEFIIIVQKSASVKIICIAFLT